MDIELKEKVKNFIELGCEFKKVFRWDGKKVNTIASLLANGSYESIDEKNVKAIRKYIRKNSKFNSIYRGEFSKVFSILINQRQDYKEVFENTKYIYNSLLDQNFNDKKEMLYGAFLLSKRFSGENLEVKLEKLLNIKDKLENSNYNFFTKEDYIVYVYLTALNKDLNEVIDEIKNIDLIFKEVNLEEVKKLDAFYLALLITNFDLNKKIEKALNIRCFLVDNYDFIDDEIYPLIGLASNFVKNDETFLKEVRNINSMLEDDNNFNKKGLSNKIIFKISLSIVLMRYLEYIKGDIIDIDAEEDNLIEIIKEYITFSVIL